MFFSMKCLLSDEKIKSAPHTLIKSCLIPNFFWKNHFFYVSKAPPSQGMTGALSVTQKSLKLTFTFLGIFFAPSSSKKKCFGVGFVAYTECSKNDRICHFMMDLKNAWFCDKNWFSWGYVDKSIFFHFKDMGLIFCSGESWKPILFNSNQF